MTAAAGDRPVVLQVLLSPRDGGAESLAAALGRGFEARGLRSEQLYLDAETGPNSVPNRVRRVGRVVAAVRSLRPAAVVSHSLYPNLYVGAARSAHLVRPPHVMVLHSATDDFAGRAARRAQRLASRRVDRVVAVSTRRAEEFRSYFPERADRVVLVPNGVAAEFRPGPNRPEPRRYLAACRVMPGKDVLTLIRGFARYAAAAGPGRRLTIAGGFQDPAYLAACRAEVERLGADDSVELLGARDDVPALMAEADVLVHASLFEADPMTLREATACALPIVSSRFDGASFDGLDHVVPFEVGDHLGLAAALAREAADHGRRSAVAAVHAADARRIDAVVDDYVAVLADLGAIGAVG